jgi:hypothetical protein
MRKRAIVALCLLSACRDHTAVALDAGVAPQASPAVAGGWVVASADEVGPRFVWTTARDPLALAPPDAARVQLERYRDALGVSAPALSTLVPVRTVTTHGGSTVTTFRNTLDGIELYGHDTSVLLRPDRSIVAIGGAPHPAAVTGVRHPFPLAIDRGVLRALDGLVAGARVAARGSAGGWQTFELVAGDATGNSLRARPVYFAKTAELRAAYLVEIMISRGVDMRGYQRVIAADTGEVLEAVDLTHDSAFTYRVWTDASKRPLDGPNTDFTPHPTGVPDGSKATPIASNLVSMESFNTPPSMVIDPWLASTATVTSGNNVNAYQDRYAPDGFTAGQDIQANLSSALTFDYTYDQTISPLANATQTKAAIVAAFYTTNFLHDYWYDSGFTESAGNGQQNNYGRGGLAGDPMLVEVQDSADTQMNNANMSAGADGTSPKMQIYIWSPDDTRFVHVGTTDLQAGTASWGPQTFDITGAVVAALDGTAPTTDACETLTNGASLSGKIALIDRGLCNFTDKVLRAQNAGAIGALIVDNVTAANPPTMGGTPTSTITIPALSLTKTDGDALRASLSGTVTARMVRQAGAVRDGALDATVVSHEWGHYLHHRLVDSCANQQCNAISEGWGDFNALHELIRSGDPMTGTYAIGSHAGAATGNAWYFGIRRTPYTTTQTKNPLTFRHIGDSQTLPTGTLYSFETQNSEVHNAGEIWAQMMFDAYAQIIASPGTRSFAEIQRDMADYIVAGLALTPGDTTYTEQRDAILAAAAAANPTDFVAMAKGFALRGAGSCAVSPARTSTTLDGVVESFTLAPVLAAGTLTLDDSRGSCDRDGILDAQERGKLHVTVTNAGAGALTTGQFTVSTTTAGVAFPSGATFALPAMSPMTSTVVDVDVDLAATFPQRGAIALTFTLASSDMCTTPVTKTATVEANRDEVPNSSATDTVESPTLAWTPTGSESATVWSRIVDTAPNHAFRGADLDHHSDTQLVSPPLAVGSGAFTMAFLHRYQFEASGGTNYDGGVIEVSTDGGTTWVDASTYGATGYTGTLTTTSGNPIGGRQAYTGTSSGFPTSATSTINFGTALANKSVLVRFRIGTDQASGTEGWTIDNIAFTGITNTPFTTVTDDMTTCIAPVANAGPDEAVFTSSTVMLDGSASSDANNNPLTYTWTQLSGPAVTLSSTTAVNPTFTAPATASVLTFQLTVSDGWASSMDTVTITVSMRPLVDAAVDAPPDAPPDAAPLADARGVDALLADAPSSVADAPGDAGAPDAATPGKSDGGGCCDSGGQQHPARDLPLVLGLAFVLRRRRR